MLRGVLACCAALNRNLKSAREIHESLLPFLPEDLDGPRRHRGIVRAVADYNLVFLARLVDKVGSAQPFLDDLREIARIFKAVILRAERAGVSTPLLVFSRNVGSVYRLCLPEIPLSRTPGRPLAEGGEVGGGVEPFSLAPGNSGGEPDKPSLAGLMRRAAGLSTSGRVRTPTRRGQDGRTIRRGDFAGARNRTETFFMTPASSWISSTKGAKC
ncbi:MAG: hypothetical protein LBR53_10305 [Deltaproteobacteria bacterium]|jgi:hypothetical protein|nr:hypothetical protein [Deltaproteobacteria bacterium]